MNRSAQVSAFEFFLEDDKSISAKFQAFHAKYPQVYDLFRKLTLEAIRKGFKNYGAKGIVELIRWQTKGTVKEDGYKVNNNYTSLYARMFETEFPQHEGFFRKRTLKADY